MSDQPMFSVEGPYTVPVERGKGGRFIPPNCPKFWCRCEYLRKSRGCYIFAIRAAKGYRPVYVGRTRTTFGGECFAPHKIAQHYGPAVANTGKGTFVMFLLVLEKTVGKPNSKAIRNLEDFLIQVAVAKNPDLSNIRGKREANWGIRGVIRGGKGNIGESARSFRKAIGI